MSSQDAMRLVCLKKQILWQSCVNFLHGYFITSSLYWSYRCALKAQSCMQCLLYERTHSSCLCHLSMYFHRASNFNGAGKLQVRRLWVKCHKPICSKHFEACTTEARSTTHYNASSFKEFYLSGQRLYYMPNLQETKETASLSTSSREHQLIVLADKPDSITRKSQKNICLFVAWSWRYQCIHGNYLVI